MPAVNPDILHWARKTAGLSLDEAARAIDLQDAHGITGPKRLEGLEKGEEEPSRPLLLRTAKAYRRSLLVFYLERPPETGDRGKDFRTLPGGQTPLYNPVLDTLIRDVRGRQSIIRSLLEDEEAEKLKFARLRHNGNVVPYTGGAHRPSDWLQPEDVPSARFHC
jgi:transcriptional regulator with XRE-family HTH domain